MPKSNSTPIYCVVSAYAHSDAAIHVALPEPRAYAFLESEASLQGAERHAALLFSEHEPMHGHPGMGLSIRRADCREELPSGIRIISSVQAFLSRQRRHVLSVTRAA
jgi:hypothetical protein